MPVTSDQRLTPAPHRLVFLHGFTQTHHHWHDCADQLVRRLGASAVTLLDMPGHGLSRDDRSGQDQAGGQIVALGGPGTYIGYSMGARFALAAAVAGHPEIERLVLIGCTAGLDDPAQRAARAADDDALADRIETIGVGPFIDEWLSAPMFEGLPVDPDDRRHRRANSAAGLASSLRNAGTGAQRSVWDRLESVRVPVLVLAGSRDAKFTEIGRRLASRLPDATFAPIPHAGHAAHAEQPGATAELIADWLSQC